MKDKINSKTGKFYLALLVALVISLWFGLGHAKTQSQYTVNNKFFAILNEKSDILSNFNNGNISSEADKQTVKNFVFKSFENSADIFLADYSGNILLASDNISDQKNLNDLLKTHIGGQQLDNVLQIFAGSAQNAVKVGDKYIAYVQVNGSTNYLFAVTNYSALQKEFVKNAIFISSVILLLCAVCAVIITGVSAKESAQINLLKQENQKLKTEQNEYKIVAKHTNQMLFRFHPENGSVQLSEEVSAIQGLPLIIESSPELSIQNGFIDSDYAQTYLDFFKSIKDKKKSFECEVLFHLSTGDVWYDMCYTMTSSGDDKPYAIISATDITERKIAEAEIIKRSMQDPLTGSLNSKAFMQKTDKILKKNSSQSHGMIMLDLDNFKNINDTFGHIMGDNVLYDTCNKLQKALNENDLISRYGGDEFMLLLTDIPNDTQEIEKRLQTMLIASQNEVKNGFMTSASLGFSRYPQDGKNFNDLYRTSDIALYNAKETGRNRFVIFNKKLDKKTSIKK